MDQGNHSKQGNALRLVKPELALQNRGADIDPRFVDLVRLLARRAAWNVFEQQMRERRRPRP